jgi:hypothetical protein
VKASVGPEADRELTDAAVFYAREGGAEIGLAFIAEYERVVALLCAHPMVAPRGQDDAGALDRGAEYLDCRRRRDPAVGRSDREALAQPRL